MAERAAMAQRGFSLLEAVVALVLIGGAGMALFGWINSNIMALGRVAESNARAEATINAIEFMRTVNPMLRPQGEAVLGNYRLHWRARAVTDIRDGVGAGGAPGGSLYQLALYDTQVVLEQVDGSEWLTLELRQVGYKKVRSLSAS